MKVKNDVQMVDHGAQAESQLFRLAEMGSAVEEKREWLFYYYLMFNRAIAHDYPVCTDIE